MSAPIQIPQMISLEDFEPYKQITENIDEVEKLNPFILEAQEFDLKPLLGAPLYLALLQEYDASPQLQTYGELYHGAIYTNTAGDTVQYNGLKPVLVYYAYSRFVGGANVTSTPFGLVEKRNDYSTTISEKTVTRIRDNARSQAFAAAQDMIVFLDFKQYALWKCVEAPSSGRSPRFRKIGD